MIATDEQNLHDDENTKKCKKRFSFDEDQILKNSVSEFGDNDWDKIALLLPGRSSRQCRDRWNKYLSGNTDFSKWTKEEDELLISLIHNYGNKWSKIATIIKGKNKISIKNRYKQLLSQLPFQAFFKTLGF